MVEKRIIDANLNRASEAFRVLEEISRFMLDDETTSGMLKRMRNDVCMALDCEYDELLRARDTVNDVGVGIVNDNARQDLKVVFKANMKRVQQSLRVLFEYSGDKVFEMIRYEVYQLEKTMYERLKMDIKSRLLEGRKLYLVTNSDAFEDEDSFLNAVASALDGGVDVVQLREKNADVKRMVCLGKRVRELCSMYGSLFIVNDRVDVAILTDADGIHIGQDDLDVESTRLLIGKDKIVGVSTHKPEQAQKAVREGADYIGVGPVFSTPTKAGRVPVGLEYVGWVSKNVNIPFFAIGGIDLGNVGQVLDAGAERVAVVRAVMNVTSPKSAAQEFLDKLNKQQ